MKGESILFLVAFITYLATISPTISLLDSPELVACAFNLIIAHPPGHALYLLLGKLFSFIPLGSLAWRLNLLSAVFACLSLLIFCLILIRIWVLSTGRGQNPGVEHHFTYPLVYKIVIFSTGLLLAFSKTFWEFAIGTETYAINTFLLALVILSLLQEDQPKFLFLAAFVAGLLIAFHSSNAIYLGGFILLGIIFFLRDFKVSRLKELPLITLFAIWGSSTFLYLPIRTIAAHGISLGEAMNWNQFFQLITGKIYFDELPFFSIPGLERLYNLSYAFLSPRYEFSGFFCLIGLIGMGFLAKKYPLLTLFFLTLILSNVFLFANSTLGFPDANIFPYQLFSSTYFVFALFIGIGFLAIIHTLKSSYKQMAVAILIILLSLYPLIKNYRLNNRSNDYNFYKIGEKMLSSLERGSIFLCNNYKDMLFFFWYFTGIEDRWKDVTPLISKPILKNHLESFLQNHGDDEVRRYLQGKRFPTLDALRLEIIHKLIKVNIDKVPIYTSVKAEYIERYDRIKKGLLYKITGIREIIAQNPRIENMVNIKYGQEIALLGYNMDKALLVPGESLNITYFWRAQRKIATDYEIVVLLANGNGEIVPRESLYSLSHPPAYGIYPTKKWRVGEIIQETSEVFIPPDYKPGRYFINVAVGDKKGLLEIKESKVPVEGRFARIGDFRVEAKEKNKAGSSSNVQR